MCSMANNHGRAWASLAIVKSSASTGFHQIQLCNTQPLEGNKSWEGTLLRQEKQALLTSFKKGESIGKAAGIREVERGCQSQA